MDGANGQNYKNIIDAMENNFSKGTVNYPTTVYRSHHIFNKKKEIYTADSAMIEVGDEEDIVYG